MHISALLFNKNEFVAHVHCLSHLPFSWLLRSDFPRTVIKFVFVLNLKNKV